jgi:imidazoleglycerol phosphate dehydratase HisB
MADAPRRTYAQRAAEMVELIDSINQRGNNPHHLHETKDAAKQKARALQRALETDGL